MKTIKIANTDLSKTGKENRVRPFLIFAAKPARLLLTLLAVITVLLLSCKKDKTTVQPVGNAVLSVVNTGVASIDVYLENSKFNPTPILFSQNTQYVDLVSGLRQVTVIKGGSLNNADILVSGNLPFESDMSYSIFISRKSAQSTEEASGYIVQDDLTAPASGKAKIRFTNQVTDAPSVDVNVKGGGVIFTNRAFPTMTVFITVDPAASYILEIHETGNSAVKLEVPVFNLEANKIYTVYINGLWDGTSGNDALTAHVITNK